MIESDRQALHLRKGSKVYLYRSATRQAMEIFSETDFPHSKQTLSARKMRGVTDRKPEIAVLGDAKRLIQGSGKTVIGDALPNQAPGPDLFELED